MITKIAREYALRGGFAYFEGAMLDRPSDTAELFAPFQLPHPTAKKVLEFARKDPSVFLLESSVPLSIDISETGSYADRVRSLLEAAVDRLGYKNSPNAEIMVVATIGPPLQKRGYLLISWDLFNDVLPMLAQIDVK